MKQGVVIKNMNGYFYVQTPSGDVHECKVRGRLKKERYSLLVGDTVHITDDGWIDSIEERRNSLRRPAIANIDQVIVVVAAREPDIHPLLLDRLLVMIHHSHIPPVLVINKYDLHTEDTMKLKSIYENIGYTVLCTSTYTGEGIEELRHVLHGKISAFAGPSGVGKSSLLNAVDPNFAFQTGAVSDKIKRGRHTTRHASLYSLDESSFIMDTPGFSALEHTGMTVEELVHTFPEFGDHDRGCKFSLCSHSHEPICSVKDALANGQISEQRYQSYLTIKSELEDQRRR